MRLTQNITGRMLRQQLRYKGFLHCLQSKGGSSATRAIPLPHETIGSTTIDIQDEIPLGNSSKVLDTFMVSERHSVSHRWTSFDSPMLKFALVVRHGHRTSNERRRS